MYQNKILTKDDLLERYDIDKHKLYYISIKIILLICEYYINLEVELFVPRSSTEMFSYETDKFWSIIINVYNYFDDNLDVDITRDMLYKVVHYSGAVNFFHWYKNFYYKKRIADLDERQEIKYYLYSVDKIIQNKEFNAKRNIDMLIVDILLYIRYINNFNKNTCKLIMKKYFKILLIPDNIVNLFHKYINDPYINSTLDGEDKKEIINRIRDI